MSRKAVNEITISPRVVEIGHQVYPLANISRVQSVKLVWAGKLGTFHPLKRILATAVVIGALGAALRLGLPRFHLGSGIRGLAEQFVTAAVIVLGLWIAYQLAVFLYRLLLRRTQYALVIETAGTQYTALYGTNQDEIHRIKNLIVAAIEEPPPHAKTYQTFNTYNGDLVSGDQYKQTGAGTLTVNN